MTSPKMWGRAFWLDLGEKLLATFLQAFLASLIVTSSVNGPGQARDTWADAALIALFATVICLITTTVTWLTHVGPLSDPYLDLGLRAAMTFGQTLLGYLAAAGAVSILSFHWTAALIASAEAAGAALLKGLVGTVANTQGAAVFVPHTRARRRTTSHTTRHARPASHPS